jgi:hypothetical protein
MHRYAAFGYRIESATALPELDPAPFQSPADWRVLVAEESPALAAGELLGTDTVYGNVLVRAYRLTSGFRIAFDDTGTFDIRTSDRAIVWYRGAQATDVAFRADLLGRVLALAAHADGCLALHASAVSIEGGAVAFIGPKHAGKSTLAMALVRHGARLLTDDMLVVRLRAGSAWAAPGVQRIRLWDDSARALRAPVSDAGGAKPTVDRLGPNELATMPVPLAACYLLEASGGSPGGIVRRQRIPPVRAALTHVRFGKLGALAGGSIGAAMLERAGDLTRAVPLLAAAVGRDLGALDAVAEQFRAWHGAARGARSLVGR